MHRHGGLEVHLRALLKLCLLGLVLAVAQLLPLDRALQHGVGHRVNPPRPLFHRHRRIAATDVLQHISCTGD